MMTPVGLEVLHFDTFQYRRHDYDGLSVNDYLEYFAHNKRKYHIVIIKKHLFKTNAVTHINHTECFRTLKINNLNLNRNYNRKY